MRRHRHDDDEANVDMTPMLDIVFIMLIFFIVTTSFTKEDALDMTRPSNNNTENTESKKAPVAIEVSDIGEVVFDGRVIMPSQVSANIETRMAENPETVVIIQAHDQANTEVVMAVIDGVRDGGFKTPVLARLPEKQ
ncbi:ExbD/TolR family protein [Pleionea litopenaei]|uniref:Biopolymer transporter ExbD n=1 Tax=Pleionea litopenaei TaxID=3070815 RepID=A0AA51X5S2_9GAMM|nr:biopolymer transporter ExbD [Pleionea sp. HL-JVS1]WMS86467.1 biopolymer transporter ExbD [Pleionea sp. HL-JVS1]